MSESVISIPIDVEPVCSNMLYDYLAKNYGITSLSIWTHNDVNSVYFFTEKPNEQKDNWVAKHAKDASNFDIYMERVDIERVDSNDQS